MDEIKDRLVRARRYMLVVVVCLGAVFLLVDNARAAETRTIKQLRADVKRAEALLSEARYVLRATRTATEHYGSAVGRWVWLARDTGWGKADISQLMYVINRESGGNPRAKNPTSTASGLLQFLAFHWDGSGDYGWSFNPFNPRSNLHYGHKLRQRQGWAPWAM